MRRYLFILAVFVVLTDAAWGGIGDVGVSEGSSNLQPSSGYVTGAYQTNGLGSQIPSTTYQGQTGFQPPSSFGLAANQRGVQLRREQRGLLLWRTGQPMFYPDRQSTRLRASAPIHKIRLTPVQVVSPPSMSST